MSTKVKTQIAVTPTPAAPSKVGGQSLFEGQETQPESDDRLDYGDTRAAAANPDPPEAQLQRAEQQGHHFEQVDVAAYTTAAPHQPRLQRQGQAGVKERWEDGAVNLKPLPDSPLSTQVSSGEKWEDGAVSLKTDSKPDNRVQAKNQDGAFAAGAQVESRLQSSQGGGQPLSDGTRDFMESRFGNDFSDVRVHNNAESVQMNQDLKAQAFTHGNDIYFNSGKYNPESTGGKRLLAHELTHTIQQTGPAAVRPKRLAKTAEKTNKRSTPPEPMAAAGTTPPKVQRRSFSEVQSRPVGDLEEVSLTVQPQLMVGTVGDRYEQEADHRADQVVSSLHEPESETVQRWSKTGPSGPSPHPDTDSSEAETTPDIDLIRGDADIALKPLSTAISPVTGGWLQRDDKDDINQDINEAVKGIDQEINSKKKGDADISEGEKGGDKGRDLANETKTRLNNADGKGEAKKVAKEMKKKSQEEVKKAEQAAEKAKQDAALQKIQDQIKAAQAAEAEKQKQAKETEAVEGEAAPLPEEGADGSAEAEEETGALDPIGTPEHLSDPGPVEAPTVNDATTPATADADPAFEAVVTQSEHVAAQQTVHKPAQDKVREAQDAAHDPAQQNRRAQSTQSNEAGEKQPQPFNREAFVTALLAVLERNKPDTPGDVEDGKGMDGASDQMKSEIDKTKEDSGGELKESSTRSPDPEIEAPKPVVPTPEAIEEAGEKPPDALIDPTAATPKPKSEAEIEKPLAETKQAVDNWVPKDKSALPPLQLKLMVGAPGDKFEQEADHMADSVMAMPEPKQPTEPAKGNHHVPAQPDGSAASPNPAAIQSQADDQDEISEADPERTALQRQPEITHLPDIQVLPGLFLQRQAVLNAEAPTQKDNPVPLDEHRLKRYEKESGIKASGELEKTKKHFGGDAQTQFRQAESSERADAQSAQTDTIATGNEEMFATRQEEFANVQNTQQEAQTQDESERGRISQEIQTIYDETKGNVNGILGRLDHRVDAEFKATDQRAKATFERTQKRLFAQWKHNYYRVRNPMYIPWMDIKVGWAYVKIRFYMKPIFNTFLWLKDKIFTGLPDEVNNIYEIAKEEYLKVQRQGVQRIADIVEEELTNAKTEVDRGRQRVQDYVAALPEDLQSVGLDAASAVQAQFDDLEQTIHDKQNAIVDDLKAKYEESIGAIDERIEELKAANASLINKVGKLLAKIGKWILRQVLKIIEPPLKLIPGIGPKVVKFLDVFVDDPGGIMDALFTGLGKGFENFGKNIKKHLINGFFEWLLGSGIEIKFPDKFDLQGIIDILLQILGISKDAIFALAESLMPDWAVEILGRLLEEGLGAFSSVMETLTELDVPGHVIAFFKAIAEFPVKGPIALWEFIKEVFSSLKGEFIMLVITQLLIPEVVIAGIQWVIGLMNPASGILKIVKAIVDIIIFVFENIDTIMEVFKAIGSAFAALIQKSWQPIATAVELALAKIIPLALGLFMSLLGLGGIPKRIGKVVKKLRTPVDKGLTKIFSGIGTFLDPIGAVEGAAGGLGGGGGQKGKKKKNKNKKKGSEGGQKTEQKKTGPPPSTEKTSKPPNAESSNQKANKPTEKDSGKGQAPSKAGANQRPDQKSDQKDQKKAKETDKNKQDQDGKKSDQDADKSDLKKKKDKDKKDKDKDKDAKSGDPRKRLKTAMKAVDRLAEQKRDPDAVKGKLPNIKKKHKLTTLTLKKQGKNKYRVTGSAKAEKAKKGTKARRKPLAGHSALPLVQPQVEADIQQAKGHGADLAPTVQSQMESAFGGSDFSGVQIHTDREGDRLSRSLNAEAFTVDRDIFFRQGSYQPNTPKGQRLLAHELTHVQQQGAGHQGGIAQRQSKQSDWNDENNEVTVKKKLKANKQKGGNFTVEAKLVEKDAILKEVQRQLKRYIKQDADVKRVKRYLNKLKQQYKLKTLKLIKKQRDGSRYQIIGEVDQKKGNKGGKSAQRVAAPGASPMLTVNPTLQTDIQRAEGQGQAIAPRVREPLETAFGTDFSPVRIHTDGAGDRLSRAMEAKAFTTGRDIFFRQGNYQPDTPSGQHLLAHELTHVVQQSGEPPVVVAQRVPRQGAESPPVQRSAQGPGNGLWIQREAEEGEGAEADLGGGMDSEAMAGMAAGAAAGMVADQVMGGGSDEEKQQSEEEVTIKSRITNENSKLTMNVKVDEVPPEAEADKPAVEKDEEPEPEGLPANIVGDIVRVIKDIVNQDPDPDVVSRKLDKVRVMFEMSLVKLVTYAEVGDAFEYIIKINGRAKFLRASKIANFLKRLGKRKQASAPKAKAKELKAAGDSNQDSAVINAPAPSPSKGGSAEAANKPTSEKTAPSSQGPEAKVTPSSTPRNEASEMKLEQAQDRETKVKSKVRRIDPETVDVIIRATPQSKTR